MTAERHGGGRVQKQDARVALDSTFGRLVVFLVVAAAGWAVAEVAGLGAVHRSPGYLVTATTLLAVGLFASTSGISLAEARENLRVVLLAVTVGVLVKAAFIATVMVAVFRRPEYLVLGVAVAQIDPLSVAAMRTRSRLSEQTRAILSAWASFDDPITMLLTIYVSAYTLSLVHPGDTGQHASAVGDDLLAALGGLGLNLAFAVGAYLLWRLVRPVVAPRPPGPASTPGPVGPVDGPGQPGSRPNRYGLAIGLLVLIGLFTVAVDNFLMLGLALAGLFFRPAISRWLDAATQTAFLVATFALGLVLVGGIEPGPGAVLGVAAFASQIVAGTVLSRGRPPEDRARLAFGQQNGITAIILALLLEPDFPGTVGIVGPAVLVINLLHALGNALIDRRYRATAPAGEPSPAEPAAR